MNTAKYICLITLLLVHLHPMTASAEIIFYVAPEGDKGFVLEGDDINEKARIELTVLYDPDILANPKVSLETGTVTDLFEPAPGSLIISADQPEEPAPSFVAHLSFDKKKDASGGILSVKGKILDPDGTITRSRTMPGTSIAATSALSTAAPDDDTSESSDEASATEQAAMPGNRFDMVIKAGKSVLQRFWEFKGKKGLMAFTELFGRAPGEPLVQVPPVVLSDGKTPVSIRLDPQPPGGGEPNIALSDAKLIQLRNEGEKGWVLTALPNKGTWNARLVVKTNEKIIEFPFVVAPQVNILQGITGRNFVAELDKYVSDPTHECKGENDPRQLPLYEYIFTANYLANSGNVPGKIPSELASVGTETKK
jgi:hypothetical protein